MDEITNIGKELLTNNSYEKIKQELMKYDVTTCYEIISEMLLQLDIEREKNISLKNIALKKDDSDNLEQLRKKIKQVKKRQSELRFLREEIYQENIPSETRKKVSENAHLRRELSAFHDIFLTRYFINHKVEAMLETYSIEKSPKKKKKLFIKVRNEYEYERIRLKEEKKKLFKQFCKILEEEKSLFLHPVFQKTEIKQYLKEYPIYQNKIQTNKEARQKVKSSLESINYLINLQNELLLKEEKKQKRLQKKDTYPIDYSKLLSSNQKDKDDNMVIEAIMILKNKNLCHQSSLLESVLHLVDHFDKEKKQCFIYICSDIIRTKLLFLSDSSLSKEEQEQERMLLKQWRNYFQQEIRCFENCQKEFPKDYYYEILISLLPEERNYYYIKRLLEEIKEFRSARGKEGHILVDILDYYILNMKYKLANQKMEYIEPKYYLNIIKEFFAYGNPLFEEEKQYLKDRIFDFRQYVKGKQSAVVENVYLDLDELEQMIDSYDYRESLADDKIKFDLEDKIQFLNRYSEEKGYSNLMISAGEEVLNQIQQFKTEFFNTYQQLPKKDHIYRFLHLHPDEVRNISYVPQTFILESNRNYAYSIYYDEQGTCNLRIHILDIAALIEKDSEEEKKLKGKLLHQNNYQFSIPKFKVGNEYPTITFQIPIDSKEKIGMVEPFLGKIKIDDMYQEKDLSNYREIENLKYLFYALRSFDLSSSIENINDIYEMTIKLLNKELGSYFQRQDRPFIYCHYPFDNDELIQKNHNQIAHLLHQIEKSKAHHIFSILDERVERSYQIERRENSFIETAPTTYLGLYLQQYLKKIINHPYLENKKEEEEEIKNLALEFNQAQGYIPEKKREKQKRKSY